MSLFLLTGPDWPKAGHPFGKHRECGGLLSWRWAPPVGVDTCGSVACGRCGAEHYGWPNGYAVDERNTAADLDALSADIPDDDEDATVGWIPKSPHLQAWFAARGGR